MKTIFLSFSLKRSSLSEFFVEVANQLSINNKIYIISYGDSKHDFNFSPNIEITKWPSERPTKVADFFYLVKLIRTYKPDILISNFGAVNMFLLTGFLLRVPHRIAWYRTLAAQLENKKFLKYRKKLVYKFATEIIANSIATKNDLVNNFDVPPKKIKVIYNAVKDPGIFSDTLKNKIIYVGRMDHIKGVSILIEAIPIVLKKYPHTEFFFIGGNLKAAEIKDYQNQVKRLRVEENVRFTGNKSKDEVLLEFSTAYLSIVPSIVEAFGYVVIESFSVRTPVIGSNTSGIAEIIRDNVDGLLFKPGDSMELASKIMEVLNDENLRDTYSKNCYEHFLRNFEVKSAARNLMHYLDNKI